MPFNANDITPEPDWTLTPQPDLDAHWWRVDRGDQEKAGWIWTPGTAPAPTAQLLADELNRLRPRLGAALDGRMVGGRGMLLTIDAPADT